MGEVLSGTDQKQEIKRAIKIKYRGNILGHSINFKKWVYDQNTKTTILTGEDAAAEGLMIISDDLSLIEVSRFFIATGTRALSTPILNCQ